MMYFIILGTLCLVYITYQWLAWHFSPYRKLPSPPGWPIFGHFNYIRSHDGMTVFRKWAEQYKEEGLFFLNIRAVKNRALVVICKPEHQKQIMSRPDKFPRPELFKEAMPLTGNGLLTSDGEDHRQQKKLLQKAFSRLQVKNYLPAFNRHISIMIQRWKSLIEHSDGINIDIKDYTSDLTFDIIGEIGFGFQFNAQSPEKLTALVSSLKEAVSGHLDMKKLLLMRFLPFLWYMPFGPAKAMRDFDFKFNLQLDEILRNRRAKMENKALNEDEKTDLLSMMMEAKDDESGIGFSDKLIKDNTFTFLIAGHETTATAIPAILYYFTQYPDLQERCREEISQILGDRDNITGEDTVKMTYLTAFIKESIRLFPPVANGRYTTEDVMIGKYLIPKNTALVLQPQVSNVDADSFDNPMGFRPERYLEAGTKVGTSFTFGYGPYNCIGKHFAMLEMKVIIARLLQCFKFHMDSDKENFIRRLNVSVVCVPAMELRVSLLEN